MKAYLDSSVILRHLLGEKGALSSLDGLGWAITSQVTRLECLRTLDRIHLRSLISSEEFVETRRLLLKVMNKLEIIFATESVFFLAESSFSVPLGSLDSLHLASAMLWVQKNKEPITFLTHDRELGLAARAQGFAVDGM